MNVGTGQRSQRRTHLWRRSTTILCHHYIVPVVGIEKHDKRARLVIVVAVVGGGQIRGKMYALYALVIGWHGDDVIISILENVPDYVVS